jgi:hypothetical protein
MDFGEINLMVIEKIHSINKNGLKVSKRVVRLDNSILTT